MASKELERAVELGKTLGRFFIALSGPEGFPYISPAHGIEQIAENQLTIAEWICPAAVRDMSRHPQLAILIWDPAAGSGYEILGRVMMIENEDYLDGYAPGQEEEPHLPQVRRRLFIRAERVLTAARTISCGDIDRIRRPQRKNRSENQPKEGSFVPFCGFAPEWAEHARFQREDPPCDDGRAGEPQKCPEEAEECVVGAP